MVRWAKQEFLREVDAQKPDESICLAKVRAVLKHLPVCTLCHLPHPTKARMPVCMPHQSEDARLHALPKRECLFVCSAKARMPVCMPHHAPPTKERKIVLPFPDSQAFLKNMSPRAWVMSKVGQNRCVHSIFGRKIAEYTVTYGVYIRFWPTLVMSSGIHTISRPQLHNDVPLDLRDHSCWLSQQ